MPSPKPRAEGTVIANSPCGCKVNGFNDKIGWHMEIAYCPLHASAPKLVAALEAVVDCWGCDPYAWEDVKENAEALLKEANAVDTPTRNA